jgi:hypothetical protein
MRPVSLNQRENTRIQTHDSWLLGGSLFKIPIRCILSRDFHCQPTGVEMKSCLSAITLMCIFGSAGNAVAQQYTNLIPDRSLHLWMSSDGNPVQTGWGFDPDGALHLSGKGGNIVTRCEYQNFDLWFEFRISEKGNSGIKYRVQKYDSSWLGLEYQIQDDAAFPDQTPKHHTASLYDLVDRSSPILERRYLPLSEWSVGRIVVQNNRLRHWMNGNLVIDECSESQHFSDAVQDSKFKDKQIVQLSK